MTGNGKPRTLKIDQKLRVLDWLRANKVKLETEKPTLLEAAAACSQDLGLDVSHGTIAHYREALSIHWSPKHLVRAEH